MTERTDFCASPQDLGKLIHPVGFWRRKAVYLHKTCRILKEKYDCDVPDTMEGLLELPGVGMKMATIAMHAAHNKVWGIGVDTHVHRIANRLGWCRPKTKGPDETQAVR